MRGKHETELARHDRHGITPADAGKTYVLNESLTHAQDHPRGCGENFWSEYNAVPVIGSPPRMRGKQNVP